MYNMMIGTISVGKNQYYSF